LILSGFNAKGEPKHDKKKGRGFMAIYYTDGSSTIGVKSAYCVTDENGKIVEMHETKLYNGKQFNYTHNEEEYRGVIAALHMCSEGDEIRTDSKLVVEQVAGRFKVKKPHLINLCETVKDLLFIKKAKLTWIGRETNLAGKVFE
jgi:ribonuclease HI